MFGSKVREESEQLQSRSELCKLDLPNPALPLSTILGSTPDWAKLFHAKFIPSKRLKPWLIGHNLSALPFCQ